MTELPGGYSLPTWQQHARRDDCLERMVPSDLRQFLGLIERQQQVIDLLMKAVEPFVEEFEARRAAYIRRYPRHPAVGADNFDTMPDGWPMEKLEFSMRVFRRAREAKVEAERILNHSHPGLEREKE